VQYLTPNFFSLLGAKPILGRIFLAEESQDRNQTLLISESFWKREFNSDPNVLGKSFTLEESFPPWLVSFRQICSILRGQD